ncbi:signal peptidase II [Helicobacter sp. 23-1044]
MNLGANLTNLKARILRRFTKKHFAFFAMMVLAIALDQAIKFLILDFYANAPSPHAKVFQSEFIDIILVFNKGVAFSFLSAVGANLKWLILAMLLFMLILVLKSDELFAQNFVAFGLIIGAGFSNLVDRFVRDGVVDYIFWHYKFNFAVFNLADSLINVAIAWVILKYIFWRK